MSFMSGSVRVIQRLPTESIPTTSSALSVPLEVYELTGTPMSELQQQWHPETTLSVYRLLSDDAARPTLPSY